MVMSVFNNDFCYIVCIFLCYSPDRNSRGGLTSWEGLEKIKINLRRRSARKFVRTKISTN